MRQDWLPLLCCCRALDVFLWIFPPWKLLSSAGAGGLRAVSTRRLHKKVPKCRGAKSHPMSPQRWLPEMMAFGGSGSLAVSLHSLVFLVSGRVLAQPSVFPSAQGALMMPLGRPFRLGLGRQSVKRKCFNLFFKTGIFCNNKPLILYLLELHWNSFLCYSQLRTFPGLAVAARCSRPLPDSGWGKTRHFWGLGMARCPGPVPPLP